MYRVLAGAHSSAPVHMCPDSMPPVILAMDEFHAKTLKNGAVALLKGKTGDRIAQVRKRNDFFPSGRKNMVIPFLWKKGRDSLEKWRTSAFAEKKLSFHSLCVRVYRPVRHGTGR